jgi:hypothetical protein
MRRFFEIALHNFACFLVWREWTDVCQGLPDILVGQFIYSLMCHFFVMLFILIVVCISNGVLFLFFLWSMRGFPLVVQRIANS